MTRALVPPLLLLLALPARAADGPPLAGAVVVVDPGHGGEGYSKSYTGGTRGVVSKQTEGELNLRVGLELAKLLREQGATVHLTRDADHRLSREGSSSRDELHARIDFFEHHACHFFVSVHHNAGPPTASGHTALYKLDAPDPLYQALARDVNDALAGAVPGSKRALLTGKYHVVNETDIPGTITESGFMTHEPFDKLSRGPDYPRTEAAAIAKGAARTWAAHEPALVALRDKLAKGRAAKPRDPDSLTAVALNPAHQRRMKELLAKVAPGGKYDAANAGDYVAAFAKTATGKTFTVTATTAGDRVTLTGEASDRADHDRLIDLFVAMKLVKLTNEVRVPKAGK